MSGAGSGDTLDGLADNNAGQTSAAEPQMSLAEWKEQQVKKKAQSTRERLRDEYAQQAARIKLGDRCEIGRFRGEVAFLGEEVEGLPGGFWVGIRYDEPVGKNDGTVKGRRLFHCHPNCGHLVRPDKVLEGAIASQACTPSSARPSSVAAASQATRKLLALNVPTQSSSDDDVCPARPNSMAVTSPARSQEVQEVREAVARARSFSPVRVQVLVTKKEDPVNKRYEKWQNIDPSKIIGTHASLDETLPRQRTGLVYDTRMEAHRSPGAFHPEQPLRITAIFAALADQGLAQKCWRVPARNATQSELVSVHTAQHVQNICNLASKSQGDLNDMASDLNSVYLCPESGNAALLASGSVVEATRLVCQNKIARACCVVRPPGHHALPSCAMGFCLFGNVAVAAKEARKRGWAQRVLIFDWDVHHGNGTQKMFWEDDTVLVFSVHRHDKGNFYPGGPEGDNYWVGEGDGRGYNINVPWPKSGAGDQEYKAVVDELLRPIAKEYKPDLVLISAGFDAAQGDPLGGCHITPDGYYLMTKACKEIANGKVVIALEGGYSLRATAQSMAACVQALLDPSKELKRPSTDGASSAPSSPPAAAGPIYLEAIEEARKVQAHFWKSVRKADDALDDRRFRSPSPAPSSRACRSTAPKSAGGWQVKRDSSSSATSTPMTSPGATISFDSKSVGGTPSTSSKNWLVRLDTTPPFLKNAGNEKTPPPAFAGSAADSSVSSEDSRGSSVSVVSSPATPATPALPSVTNPRSASGLRSTVGRNNSANSRGSGSRGSGSSTRSWQGWDDDSD